MINVFAKRATVMPLDSNKPVPLGNAISKAVEQIGKQPEILFSDGFVIKAPAYGNQHGDLATGCPPAVLRPVFPRPSPDSPAGQLRDLSSSGRRKASDQCGGARVAASA